MSHPADRPRPERPRVAVVFGGRSSEHAVSCMTARQVLAAIDPARYEVVPVGIARDGRWVLQPAELPDPAPGVLPSVEASGSEVVLSSRRLSVTEPGDVPRALGEVDVVLPLLHGPWGEDGTLQGLLEMADVRYVGAGVLASAVSMDKAFAKLVFASAGLAQLPYVVVTARAWKDDPAAVRRSVEDLGYPVFVKPARAGSSMGVSAVAGPDDLDAALRLASEHDPKVIVEVAATRAREIECGILERLGAGPEASVVGEIAVDTASDHDFYDFEAKYVDGTGANVIPADLDDDRTAEVRTSAVRAFEALGCEGLARVDFFLLPTGELVINEVNTMPGFTPYSMFPQLWQASGLDYPALVDRLLSLALARDTGLR
ncbi:MAG: D-alanine--D-alanine ligase family protein [Nocardioidaceae bacterium]|nr:D-alanine--D-alanine ligase family protein [Nocardioidaceae bacterium]